MTLRYINLLLTLTKLVSFTYLTYLLNMSQEDTIWTKNYVCGIKGCGAQRLLNECLIGVRTWDVLTVC